MSIQHALLTSLLEQPSSGYDLAARFDRSFGYFWRATHQQIYRELARMADSGWIRAEDDPNAGARRRKVYHVLPAGREELIHWVGTSELSLGQDKSLLVKLRADAIVGPLPLRRQVLALMEQHRDRLEQYRHFEQRDFSGELSRAQQLQYAVLRCGLDKEENWLAWAETLLPILGDEES